MSLRREESGGLIPIKALNMDHCTRSRASFDAASNGFQGQIRWDSRLGHERRFSAGQCLSLYPDQQTSSSPDRTSLRAMSKKAGAILFDHVRGRGPPLSTAA